MSTQHSQEDNGDILIETWKQLSDTVHRMRHTPNPASTNVMLQTHIDGGPFPILAPLLSMWVGDNLLYSGRPAEAVAAYERLITHFPGDTFRGTPWSVHALKQMSNA